MDEFFKIRSNTDRAYPGSILIAEPLLPDQYFRRSVVLLIDHKDEEGTLGVILNKPIDVKLNKIVSNFEFKNFNSKVFFGGPVATNNLFFLHTSHIPIENSVEVIKGLYWGGNIEQINSLIRSGQLSEDQIRFYIGYAGWTAKQLRNELKKNSWAVAFAYTKEIWYTDPKKLWDYMISKLGIQYTFWRKIPLEPEYN